MSELVIKNLHVSVETDGELKEILRGVDFPEPFGPMMA